MEKNKSDFSKVRESGGAWPPKRISIRASTSTRVDIPVKVIPKPVPLASEPLSS